MMQQLRRQLLSGPFILAATILLLSHQPCMADETGDNLKISAGVFDIFRYDSTASLTEPNSGLGVSFTPEDTLGWSSEQAVTRLDGRFRFSGSHALSMTWYSMNTSGNRSIQEDLDWVDLNGDATVIPIGAGIRSQLQLDTFKLSYFWSFYHTDKVELSLGAGLHVTKIDVDLAAEITSTSVAARDASTTLPLPVLGVRMNYNITPKVSWYVRTEVFSVQFDDWDGAYTTAQFGMEYRAFEHVGFGIGIGSDALILTEDAKYSRFEFKNRLTGLHAFVSAYF